MPLGVLYGKSGATECAAYNFRMPIPPGFDDEHLYKIYVAGLRARDDAAREHGEQVARYEVGKDRFFEHLAIFALSAVALSITFVTSTHTSLAHLDLMRIAWLLLLVGAGFSAARLWRANEYRLNRQHLAFLEAEDRAFDASIMFFSNVPSDRAVVSNKSAEEIDPRQALVELRGRQTALAAPLEQRKKAVNAMEWRNKRDEFMATLCTILGVAALALWASLNLPG